MREEHIGKVTHFWPKAGAAQVELDEGRPLHVGDKLRVVGHGHDFVQMVDSIEIEHESKTEGWPGEPVAIATKQPVHANDVVFRIVE